MTTTDPNTLHHPPKPAGVGLDASNRPADEPVGDFPGNGRVDAPAAGAPGISDLIKNLRDESLHLLRQEVNLAKTEAAEKARFFANQSGKLAAGVGALLIGGLGLLSAASFLLGGLIDGLAGDALNASAANGIGFLIVGTIVAIVGYALYAGARKRIAAEPLTPERTLRSLQNDKDWAVHKGNEATAATKRAVGV